MTRTIAIASGLVAAALLAVGCGGKAHLSDDFGDKSRAHFEAQRVSQEPVEAAPDGLDPEEASIIQSSYRKSIGADEREAASPETKVLVVEEPR